MKERLKKTVRDERERRGEKKERRGEREGNREGKRECVGLSM